MCADVSLMYKRANVTKMRTHDYIYDSAYIVSGARDYARTAFKAAMESAQVVIQPIYKSMFSTSRKYPRVQLVYHTNCRLPVHIDRSYSAYVERTQDQSNLPQPELGGRDRFMFGAMPRKVLPLKSASPDFEPPTHPATNAKPITRGMQTMYRESSAQTHPWQPDGKRAEHCANTPEVLYLDKLQWGPGEPYRLGDLPADFHTTEIINKMRHARAWNELIERGIRDTGMKKRDAVICDVETRDWVFRETEIDELQEIRLALLHKLQLEERSRVTSRSTSKLAKLWHNKKTEMAKKIANIHKTRDREVRKLEARHSIGGNVGLARNKRMCRGGGDMISACKGSAPALHAPPTRNGFQARTRHARLTYDLSLLEDEDHEKVSQLPPWLEDCSRDMKKSCSGHHLPLNKTQLCERVTKWNEQYLENLHNDLKKARLGTDESPAALLKRRKVTQDLQRVPSLPELCPTEEENGPSILLQRLIRGRAVQNLMYEGRSRASELIMEVKSTHGLQIEDKERIAREEARARDFENKKLKEERKDLAMSALVEELCGAAVSSALDFLDKELKRLQEERLQHAFILIAKRERMMREAAEAGRRQKEEIRRKEHDEMFKTVVGITQETVDAYLHDITEKGVEHAAATQAEAYIRQRADDVEATLSAVSKEEQDSMVCELVHQFLLPEAHKAAARERIERNQKSKMAAARESIFGVLDYGEEIVARCTLCGNTREKCPCAACPGDMVPVEKPEYRDDPRWKYTKGREETPVKDISEKFPPKAEFRCMLDTIVDEAVMTSRARKSDLSHLYNELNTTLKEKFEIQMDCKSILERCVDIALDELPPQPKEHDYHFYMKKEYIDAMDRSARHECRQLCPKDLPSELRRKAEEAGRLDYSTLPTCTCNTLTEYQMNIIETIKNNRETMLPSELRILEEILKCKCDIGPAPTPASTSEGFCAFDDEKTLTNEDFALTQGAEEHTERTFTTD